MFNTCAVTVTSHVSCTFIFDQELSFLKKIFVTSMFDDMRMTSIFFKIGLAVHVDESRMTLYFTSLLLYQTSFHRFKHTKDIIIRAAVCSLNKKGKNYSEPSCHKTQRPFFYFRL